MPARRPLNGMTHEELMALTVGDLFAGMIEDQEALRALTIEYPGRGQLVIAMACEDLESNVLMAAVVDRVNAERAARGLPPREGPRPAPRKEDAR